MINFSIKELNAFAVIGQEVELTNYQKKNIQISTQFWRKFNSSLKKAYLSQSGNWVKYAFMERRNGKLYYFCSIPQRTITPEGFLYKEIPSYKYLVVEHIGAMGKIYETYRKEISSYMQYAKSERLKSDERQIQKYILKEQFKEKCLLECPNEDELCNIVLDLCYSKSKYSKQFAWDICGEVFIQNLLRRKNYKISYPTLDDNGNIEYLGMKFSMKETEIKVNVDLEDNECQLY